MNTEKITTAQIGYPAKDLPNIIDEDYTSQMAKILGGDKKIRPITFQVTDRCNLCCSYCYQINKGVKILSMDTAKKFIDYLLDSTEETNKYINPSNTAGIIIDFIGGEPFLEVDLMDQICEYFISQMIIKDHPWKDVYRISVGTNGTLYFNESVQRFIHKYKNNLSITITIDGNKELHDSCRVFPDGSGSYNIAVNAAKDYMDKYNAGGITNTKLTIAPGNVDYFYDAIVNLIDLGYKVIHANCVFEEGWTPELAKIYYYQLKKVADYLIDNNLFNKIKLKQFDPSSYIMLNEEDNNNWCGGDGKMLALDPDGKIFNCVRYMESSLGDGGPEPLCIGDVDTGIGSNEAYKQNINCMQCITRRSQSTDKCFYCPIGRGCAWCSAYNYQCFGTPNKRATFICDMHAAESLANSYYYNRYAEIKAKEDPSYIASRISVNCPYDWAIKIIDNNEYNMLVKLSHMDRRKVRV